MLKKKHLVLIALVAALIFGGGYYALSGRTSVSAASAYLFGQAKIGNVTKVVTATGTLQNDNYANLSFSSSGRVAGLYVKVGDSVKKGAVLAELDKTVLQNRCSRRKQT